MEAKKMSSITQEEIEAAAAEVERKFGGNPGREYGGTSGIRNSDPKLNSPKPDDSYDRDTSREFDEEERQKILERIQKNSPSFARDAKDLLARKARALGTGVTGIVDLAGLAGSAVKGAVTGSEINSPGMTEWFRNKFGDIGDDDLLDTGIEVITSLLGAGKIRKGASAIPVIKDVASAIASRSPEIAKKFGRVAGEIFLPKSFTPVDVASGVASIKASENAADALDDYDIDPYAKAGLTLGAGIGAGTLTSKLSQKALSNIVDPSKVDLLKKMDMPLELARVLNDDSSVSESIRNFAQSGADLPFNAKAHKKRAQTIERAKDYLNIPADYQLDAPKTSKVYRDAFEREQKALRDMVEPLKQEAGIGQIENPEYIKYLESQAAKQQHVSEAQKRAEPQANKLNLKEEAPIQDYVYNLDEGEFDQALQEAYKHKPNTKAVPKSYMDKVKFIQKYGDNVTPSPTIMKYGDERFSPYKTRALLNSFDSDELSKHAKFLRDAIEHAPEKDVNIKTIRKVIESLNSHEISDSMSSRQKDAIFSVAKTATKELEDALGALDPKAGKAYAEFREKFSDYATDHPKKLIKNKTLSFV